MKKLIGIVGLGAMLLASYVDSASAALPPGISGAWYDPAKSGQGLSIDMLSRDHAVVSWAATDLDGHPFNLYIEARIDGERLVGRALAPRGLRFGEWDRADLEVPDWGEVRIDFSDCNSAVLSWTPDGIAGVGFPAGSMNLRRLTALAGVRCDFGRPADPPVTPGTASVKVFDGSFPLESYDPNRSSAIDPEGRLWSVTSLNPASTLALPRIPLPDFSGWSPNPMVVIVGEPFASTGGNLTLDVRRQLPPYRPTIARGSVDTSSGRSYGNATPTQPSPDFQAVRFLSPSNFMSAALKGDADRSLDFAGRYRLTLVGRTAEFPAEVDIDTQGSICMRFATDERAPCEFKGRLELAYTGAPFVDFVIERRVGPTPERYEGRGWLQGYWTKPTRVELVLVGRGQDQSAWGLVGVRQ